MMLRLKTQVVVNDVKDFVRQFKIEALFKEHSGMTIDEWDYQEADDETIDLLLDKMEGHFFSYTEEGAETFIIFEFEKVVKSMKFCNECNKEIKELNELEREELKKNGSFVCTDCIQKEMELKDSDKR